ncbi:MAG: NUDIX domain-containing protein [Clostridia bacterium]|nr:NUDIX domain-containing protein [Clostridia bacterium]
MEIFDICDARGIPTGETISRQEAHKKGVRHRTAHIWVARREEGRWQVLLQLRAQGKDSYPGCLDTSSAGHIQAGDEPLPSALRELNEELGIRAEADELTFIGKITNIYEEAFYGEPFRDNEISFVYVYLRPVDMETLRLQREEVERVEWRDLEDTIHAVRAGDSAYCLPLQSIELLKEYLQNVG